MCDFFFEFFLSFLSLLKVGTFNPSKEEREKDPPWTKKNEIVKKNKRATNACVCSFLRKDEEEEEEEEEEEDKRVTSFDVSFQHQ